MRRYSIRGSLGAFACAALLASSGCGDTVILTPVEGVVKIDGKPAANISIQFLPDVMKGGKGPTSYATSDADGKFKLQTYEGKDGAVPGSHRVVLVDIDEERPAQGQAMKKRPRLDGRFSLPNAGLAAEVTAGSGPLLLEATGPR